MNKRLSVGYGLLPSENQFIEQYKNKDNYGFTINNNKFTFNNDFRMGTCTLSRSELWEEVNKAHDEFSEGNEESGEWIFIVLEYLNIEWI